MGRVVDDQGNPVESVAVIVESESLIGTRVTITNAYGFFSVTGSDTVQCCARITTDLGGMHHPLPPPPG